MANRSFLMRAVTAGRHLFGYEATESKGRRQAPQVRTMSEDLVMSQDRRRKLQATAADLSRNFELAAWMIRMHVAYVSQFDLHVATGNPDLDREITALFDWHGRKRNFDTASRHSRSDAMRLFEIAKVFDGDAAFIKTGNGSLQGLPGKRIYKPADAPKSVNDRGLVLASTGEVLQYCVCRWKNDGKTLEYDHLENAQNVIFDGYFQDFDQTRGISPLASAINRMQDTREAFEWTHLKIKLHSLFGIVFKRDAPSGMWDNPDDDDDATGDPQYKVSLDKGVMSLDLKPGDDVDTIESKTPSSEFLNYTELAIRIALLSLDIPYTFLDSSKASFSARIADANQYEFLCEPKREKNQAVMQEYSDWKLAGWMASPNPRFARMREMADAERLTVPELQAKTQWIGRGTPWVDKLKQIQGDEKAIANGLDSRQRIARRRGQGNVFRLFDELAEEERYATEKGATLMLGASGQKSSGEVKKNEAEGSNQ